MVELLDLEGSFEQVKKLNLANQVVLPINANLDEYESKVKKLGFPVWIKLNTSEHKVKIQAIEKANTFEELKTIHNKLKKKFSGKKFIIQENIEGTEILAGIKQDKTFGKVLLLATGGSIAETIKDVSFRVCPVSETDILESLKELKIFPQLKKKDYPISSLVSLIYKFSNLKIEEADLNPIIINEKKVVVVDARVGLPKD